MTQTGITDTTLNRWLNRNPVTALARAKTYIDIPAFSISFAWDGYSEIIGVFEYTSPNKFSFKKVTPPSNPDYTLCIAFEDGDGNVTRYRLWAGDEEVIYGYIADYDGELIENNFRFEVWSGNHASVSQVSGLRFYTTVLQDVNAIYEGAGSGTVTGSSGGGGSSSIHWLYGHGSPEGVVTASQGATYLDVDSDSLWAKKTGNGNTGWIQMIA